MVILEDAEKRKSCYGMGEKCYEPMKSVVALNTLLESTRLTKELTSCNRKPPKILDTKIGTHIQTLGSNFPEFATQTHHVFDLSAKKRIEKE